MLLSRATPMLLFTVVPLLGCSGGAADSREIELVSVMTTADESLILTRPDLVASKYRAMARHPHDFLRGSFPLYLHDLEVNTWGFTPSTHFADVAPFSIGDAHIENFGALLGRDGSLVIEPNDFDAADRHPYLAEVRRLASSLIVATHTADENRSFTSGDAAPAFHLARSYGATLRRLADGEPRTSLEEPGFVLADVLDRATEDRDSREELTELTVVEDGVRSLVRGRVDNDDPENVYEDVPDLVSDALPEALANYASSLEDPPPGGFFEIKDVAREFGSGVASRARVRFIILVEGPTTSIDDDVMLEMKELGDSGARVVTQQEVEAESVQGRVLRATELCWTAKDAQPLWGVTELFGFPMQVRLESASEKSLRALRLVDELGSPEALEQLGRDLGALLANVHAGSLAFDPTMIERISMAVGDDLDRFATEQADAATVMAELVVEDHARFVHALETFGPTLGLEPTDADALRGDVALVVGDPPEAP